MLDLNLASVEEIAAAESGAEGEAREAATFAGASPWPDPATATNHIFSKTLTAPPAPPQRGTREVNFMQATLEALSHAMERDEKIFVLGEGIGVRGGNFKTTLGLFAKHGAMHLRDTPIAERGFVGLACGAAMAGARPVVDFMFADFLLDSLGELFNQIAKMQYMSSGRLTMPVLLRGCVGIGHSAATHHSGSYYSLFANIPGLRVVVPSNAYDAKGLLAHALRCNDPVVFLEPREILNLKDKVPEEDYEIPFGVASICRPGSHLTALAIGAMVPKVLQAAEVLHSQGVEVEVIDPRTLQPLDTQTILASVAKTGRLLIVDEAFGPCGIGAEIAALVADLAFDDLDAPVKRLHGAHTPTPYSPSLEAAVVLSLEQITAALRALAQE